jgi:hypothetical protein
MDKINKILQSVVKKKGLSLATDAAQICYLTNKWADGRFEALSLSRGTLKLGALNHCQAQECQMLEEELLEYLEEVSAIKVERIRWEVAEKKEEQNYSN